MPSISDRFSASRSPSAPSVTSTRTTIVLETVKEDPRISIPKELTLQETARSEP